MSIAVRTVSIAVLAFATLMCAVAQAEGQESATGDQPATERVDALEYSPPVWPDAPDTEAMLKRLAMGTATVIGLCVATMWLGRRWLRGVPIPGTTGNRLQLLESVALGNRCSVHLLRSGEHQILVGVDASGLKSLVPLPHLFDSTLREVQSLESEHSVRDHLVAGVRESTT